MQSSYRLPQPPLVKGAPRQRRGIGSTSRGPKFAKQTLGLPLTLASKEAVAEPACKPGSVVDSHSSGRIVADTLEQPTRTRRGPRHGVPIWPCSRWGLPCRPVARLAVRSYRTISPLPSCRSSLGRFAFCCTFRRLAPPRRYLAPCPVEPGLSSAPEQAPMTRLPGRLRRGHYLMRAAGAPHGRDGFIGNVQRAPVPRQHEALLQEISFRTAPCAARR